MNEMGAAGVAVAGTAVADIDRYVIGPPTTPLATRWPKPKNTRLTVDQAAFRREQTLAGICPS
jgi:hypothetical protein